MAFITKTHLPRRSVLRGVGATLALPLLDCMVPALTALSKTAAAPVRRFGVFYVPNGMSMGYFVPKTEGPLSTLPRTLEPLTPFKDQLLVLSGLADKVAAPRPEDGGGDHSRAAGTFLTGVHIKKSTAPEAATSVDQIAARELGKQTQLASLELALESVEVLGGCEGVYSCAYVNTISWLTATTPLPMENDPRVVFERLFGTTQSTDARARREWVENSRSLLDSVNEDLIRLRGGLGRSDRTKLTEYLEAVREVERRIQKAEEQSGRELPLVDQPAGIPTDYADHAELMMDLIALAFQTDLTRVSTFMLAKEISARAYPEIGVADSHHPLSHHKNDPQNLDKLGVINGYHMSQFAHLVEKLKSTPEGDSSLLDHTILLYGSGISDSNTHFHDDLPIALLGGAAAGIKGGRHIRYPQGTPLTNLFVTVLDMLGVPAEKFGDSTGKIRGLTL